jgi:poly-gamma-glutamate synthesis protein (capsule biosynthesis protein)
LLPQIDVGGAASSLFLPSISSSASSLTLIPSTEGEVVEPTAVPTPTSTLVPTEGAVPVWIDPTLPEGLRAAAALPPGFAWVDQPEQAALLIEVGDEPLLGRWVYALAAPFDTTAEGTSSVALRHAWNNAPMPAPILVDQSTFEVFIDKWGPPASGAVQVLPTGELLAAAWDNGSWAIIPFEHIEPRWKVLEVDGMSPLRKSFDEAAYALSVPVALRGDPELVEAAGTLYGFGSQSPILPPSNRDPSKLTVLAMTGVTALVRATAFTMEQRGVLYPGKDVGEILRLADITHISNEVPFDDDCPYPDPVQEGMRFCSADRYLALLQDMSADVIELTGDHFADRGPEAMRHTLDLYDQTGMRYYGGGRNYDEGRQALLVEHNGNKIAFIGCNGKGGGFATAGDGRPGAVSCDFPWLEAEIARLRSEGYLPVVTFQHFEYYTYKAQPAQEKDFRRVAGAGAVVVSGSQAHQPQAFEFVDQALIHYGLGNLFFDQYDVSPACRQGFIDQHAFYDGRYLGADLTGIQFVDYARPRLMTESEQQDLLQTVFKASGW